MSTTNETATGQSLLFDAAEAASTATLSACGTYRYRLGRRWGDGPAVNWIMLNPSTADATEDDPTIRRCIGFAKAWGYGGIEITNLFAFRATDPAALRFADRNYPASLYGLTATQRLRFTAIGPDNDSHLSEVAVRTVDAGGIVVCAWGANGGFLGRGALVAGRLVAWIAPHPLHALKITKQGHPQHPLYLKGDLRPVPWEPASASGKDASR